jgi:predicted HAD superfamily Cof-like phosphohydrolase
MKIREARLLETDITIPMPEDHRNKIRLRFRTIGGQWICVTSNEVMLDISKTLDASDKTQWVRNISAMHQKFGFNKAVNKLSKKKLKAFLEFRINFLQEELDELKTAKSADDAVDALLDLCVVAIGTLDAFGVDSDLGWNRIHEKNMQKEVGVKQSRPNPLNLPDLIKPAGWEPPSHADNIGLLGKLF